MKHFEKKFTFDFVLTIGQFGSYLKLGRLEIETFTSETVTGFEFVRGLNQFGIIVFNKAFFVKFI